MKTTTSFAALCFVLLSASCGNNNSNTENKTEKKSEKTDDVVASTACCFTTEAEGVHFLPPPSGDVKLMVATAKGGGTTVGCDDIDANSNFNQTYTVTQGPLYLRIFDYCRKPAKLIEETTRRKANSIKAGLEVKELVKAGVYNGYAYYDEKNKSSYLFVDVDDRFAVQIQGMDQVNFTDIFKLFDIVPLEELAKYKK